MEILFFLFVFLFGAIIGSFLNVVIYRLGTGTSIVRGRSMCFACGKILRWFELLPIVSFLVQRGKCRTCKSKVSWQYPLVEGATAALFALTVWMQGIQAANVQTFFYWTVMAILIVIAVYDMRHKIIPNGFVYAFIALSLIQLTWTSNIQVVQVWDWMAGPVLFLPFAALWFFSKGTWMGFGDAKLAWGIGWFLGLYGGTSALMLAFWIGALYGLALIGLSHIGHLLQRRKRFTMKSEIPFGPFLILGTLLVFFFDIDAFALVRIF